MYRWEDLECSDLWEIADSFLDGALLTETDHAVIKHIEACASCRRELNARRQLRSTLRSAFMHAQELSEPAGFADRLRRLLRSTVSSDRSPFEPRR